MISLLLAFAHFFVGLETGQKEVQLEIDMPINEQESYQGLSQDDSIHPFQGMLFQHLEEVDICFTMRETRFPLTLLFFDQEGKLLEVVDAKALQHSLIKPKQKASYTLEVHPNLKKEFPLIPGTTEIKIKKET